MTTEKRVSGDLRLELRAGGKARKLVGYAALFDTPTDIAGLFREQVAPGAFTRAIREDDVRALVDHDPRLVLGRNVSGTLKLAEDETGLRVEIDPPDTQTARDLLHLVERGDVTGMSFGFRVRGETWEHDEEPPLRTLTDVELFDVSVATFPAYPETGVAVRSLQQHRARALREKLAAGVSLRSSKP